MNIENLRITHFWKEECKYVLFEETKYDDWWGEIRTYTYEFEVIKHVFIDDANNHEVRTVWSVRCHDILAQVDGTDVNGREEYEDGTHETWKNDLSKTPTGIELINQLKDTFSI